MFNPKSQRASPTLTTGCGSFTTTSSVLILESKKKGKK